MITVTSGALITVGFLSLWAWSNVLVFSGPNYRFHLGVAPIAIKPIRRSGYGWSASMSW